MSEILTDNEKAESIISSARHFATKHSYRDYEMFKRKLEMLELSVYEYESYIKRLAKAIQV